MRNLGKHLKTCAFIFLIIHRPVLASFVVHEWGTFTSLQDSSGKMLEGMHHEEAEPLPAFVYGRADLLGLKTGQPIGRRPRCTDKCPDFDVKAFHITQKMETPVIYFYSSEPRRVTVRVDFPQGIISQWYPQASRMFPALGTVDDLKSKMEWVVDISAEPKTLNYVERGNIWEPSRIPASDFVSVGAEVEKHIFYRGLGDFDSPLRVTSDDKNILHMSLTTQDRVDEVLLLNFDGQKGVAQEVKWNEAAKIAIPNIQEKGLEKQAYVAQASQILRNHLLKAKLSLDEANAMIGTWEKSYFNTPGVRVLYVVPRRLTDNILPLKILPQPDQIERVMVGRVEVMSFNEEQRLLTNLRALVDANSDVQVSHFIDSLGRLAEPKMLRLLALGGPDFEEKVMNRYGNLFR